MGRAYVDFAVKNSSHYRVMFGGYITNHTPGTEIDVEGARAFQVLVDALTAMLDLKSGTAANAKEIQAKAGEVLGEMSLAAQLRMDAVEKENRGLPHSPMIQRNQRNVNDIQALRSNGHPSSGDRDGDRCQGRERNRTSHKTPLPLDLWHG
jgi:hypothetical protein